MDGFIHFMQSITGRTARILAGMILIVIGLVAIQGVWGAALAVIGLLPVFAGMARICLFAPLFGYTWDGRKRTGAMES